MLKIKPNEYADFYQSYVQNILENDKDIVENLEGSYQRAYRIFSNMGVEIHEYQYAENKWTIKEILQHLIDTERIFNYRALRFARNDTTELPGYEENNYVLSSKANQREFKDLWEEFSLLRQSSTLLYRSFDEEMLMHLGVASGSNMSVRALGFITSGHLLHHLNVIEERYL